MPPHIAAFQLAGYSAWNGEDAGSSPACYTQSVRLTARTQDFHSCNTGSIPVQITVGWCNGNISDSESEDVGSNPTPISIVGFSLFGKASHCGCGEQGSKPEVNLEGLQFNG